MTGAGYIYFWRMEDDEGNIRVCKGQFSGLNVGFAFADCDKPLQKKLRGINVNKKRQCPPPEGALLVTFDLRVGEGDMVATGVSETS